MRDATHLTRIPEATIRRYARKGKFQIDESVRPKLYGIPDSCFASNDDHLTATRVNGGRMTVDDGQSTATRVSDGRMAVGDGQPTANNGQSTAMGKSDGRMAVGDGQPTANDGQTGRIDSHADGHDRHLAARLHEDKAHLREELRTAREESSQRESEWKARVTALEATLGVREVRIEDLTAQVSVLESKVREILENGQAEALGLANRIADLVERQHSAEVRIYELQPVAERVPMLEAAVDETKTRLHETEGDLVERDKKLFERERQLADISEDIETIASRPVAGPVFRLLTKGKLRI
jgi:hypothetical protein